MLVTAALLCPLIGAALIRLGAARMKPRGAAVIAAAAVGAAHVLAWAAFAKLTALPPEARSHDLILFTFLDLPGFRLDAVLRWDTLSQMMLLMVTGIAFLIHLYSAAYMEGDERYAYFFADLNLFVFSMLLLVLAGNFLLLFAGWELVGLSSYLLIGFWSGKDSAASAGRKAFLVNRVGDFGFLLGILLIAVNVGALDFTTVFATAHEQLGPGTGLALAVALLLFCGAMGKSAQFPLHVWLADAMEGPTPVSALIHAATMVTAGVYMVCRCHVLFALAPFALAVVGCVGALTALLAGAMGLAQNDLKRILAYSTVSQLGLMFLGAGVGAYDAAMFHLFTHAFFKALLFLGAGSVMHAMHGELDVWKMGGLRRHLPWTFWTFLIGTLALTGAPLTAGFFSKDELLWRAFIEVPFGRALWGAGLVVSLMTALYSFRVLWLVFFGRERFDTHHVHPHESPPLMLGPLVVLSIGAIAAGYLWLPHLFGGNDAFARFLAPALTDGHRAHHPPTGQEFAMAVAVAVFAAGLFFASRLWRDAGALASRVAASLGAVHELARDKFMFDEVYAAVLVRPLWRVSGWLERRLDHAMVDGAADGLAAGSLRAGAMGSKWQSGHLRHYAMAIALGAAVLASLTWIGPMIWGNR